MSIHAYICLYMPIYVFICLYMPIYAYIFLYVLCMCIRDFLFCLKSIKLLLLLLFIFLSLSIYIYSLDFPLEEKNHKSVTKYINPDTHRSPHALFRRDSNNISALLGYFILSTADKSSPYMAVDRNRNTSVSSIQLGLVDIIESFGKYLAGSSMDSSSVDICTLRSHKLHIIMMMPSYLEAEDNYGTEVGFAIQCYLGHMLLGICY